MKINLFIIGLFFLIFITTNQSAKELLIYADTIDYDSKKTLIAKGNVKMISGSEILTSSLVIVNEKELRHEMRDKNGRIEILMKKFSIEQDIKNLIVTQGKDGSIFYSKKKNKFCSCDAFAKESLDKVGAGDAMLSTIALCLKSGFDEELSLLSGSLAAAQSVETFANKEMVNKIRILKSIEHILK